MDEMHVKNSIARMIEDFESSTINLFSVERKDFFEFEKGVYGVVYAKPSKRLKAALSIDREVTVVFSSFRDQQQRTIKAVKQIIDNSTGRLESTLALVIHKDAEGNAKLKSWGRDLGINILPICYENGLPKDADFEKALQDELFSHDPFDVTGPVSSDAQFYGRKSEAQDLARKLQRGQIHSYLGIRKIGKTSILNRVVREIETNYDSICIMVDCSKDEVWNLDAAQLMASIANTVEEAHQEKKKYLAIRPVRTKASIETSTKRIAAILAEIRKPVIILMDEVDYITPGSPTTTHWKKEFNVFWRNFRSVYQESTRTDGNMSLFICGVSSKWFNVESVDGIENAALALIPEEYLRPFERQASVQMIKKTARTVGLTITDSSADKIAAACADMPFWIRKACSYINSRVSIDLRPVELDSSKIDDYLDTFVHNDGATIAQVALKHLFRVYPELERAFGKCFDEDLSQVPKSLLSVLERYGVIASRTKKISSDMIRLGYDLIQSESKFNKSNATNTNLDTKSTEIGDWAEDLAQIGKRRNVLERRLRSIVVNFIRADVIHNKTGEAVTERVLKSRNHAERTKLAKIPVEEILEQFYWKELCELILREWSIFQGIFLDKGKFNTMREIINKRPDAHAKSITTLDVESQYEAFKWFDNALAKLE